jgi:phage-related protein
MVPTIREIAWIKGARKDFAEFPRAAQDDLLDALSVVAEGGHPSIAKPLRGLGSGVLEPASRRDEAIPLVYAVQIGVEIWVVHAFQKKSKSGIATPKAEIDLIRDRIKRLKEALP